MRMIYALAVAMCCATGANATMPLLTAQPGTPTLIGCREWALSQTEDAIEMWGRKQNGSSSRDTAIKRLIDLCRGVQPPDIVYFGSSVGFDDAYCKEHKTEKICLHAKL